MDRKLALEEVQAFYNTYVPDMYDFFISNYKVCETKLEKDILVLKLIEPYFRVKSELTAKEWKENIVAPIEESILCLEEEGITWEDYYKYLEEYDLAEEDDKRNRAEKMEERRRLRQAEKRRFKEWFNMLKKEFPENTDYMAEGFKRGLADTNKYSKLQFKVIGTIMNNTYQKDDRLFWTGFRQGLLARGKDGSSNPTGKESSGYPPVTAY